jgi:rod shape-determining protein MreC
VRCVCSHSPSSLAAIDRRVSALFEGTLGLVTAQRRARRLEAENAELRREIGALRMAMRRLGRWPAMVAAAETLSTPAVAVEILTRGPLLSNPVLVIDAGEEEGIGEGLPVMAPAGLVGRVIGTSAHDSQVRLIIAENISVTALLGSGEQTGVVTGLGRDDRLEFIPQDQGMEITIGASVLTAGLEGSLFPSGLLIGQVSEVGTTDRGLRRAFVRPAADFRHLDDLLVLIGPPPRLRPLEARRLLTPPPGFTEPAAVVRASPEVTAEPFSFEVTSSRTGQSPPSSLGKGAGGLGPN